MIMIRWAMEAAETWGHLERTDVDTNVVIAWRIRQEWLGRVKRMNKRMT